MTDIYQQSLDLHEKLGGKLEVKSKMSINTREDLSLLYTPGVAQASIEIGKNPALAKIYTIKKNTVAVVSDGSAILGLGNLGALAALPVMEGKAVLFKEFANVDAFPICLDTQDTEEIIKIVKAIAPPFGGINLEDISAPRCFEIESRLKKELDIPVMHDDQWGTATVVLAGLINGLKLRGSNKADVKIVINGAGAAGIAVTRLLLQYGFKNIIICDSKGAISVGRADLNDMKQEIAILTNNNHINGTIHEVIRGADIFIGVSAKNILNADDVRNMAERPILFAMANPTPEIMPEDAKAGGAFIVATGRSDMPNQVNNVLAFPGIFRGVLDNNIKQITTNMLIRAAESLANYVQDLSPDKILPNPLDKEVAKIVAEAMRER